MTRKRTARLILLIAAATVVCGCNKPLFPSGQPRTQFERFDQVRNQSTPQWTEDEFGRRRPNVQARLEPK